MKTLWQDLRYGVRLMFKNPGFTLAALFTLALGIGANTALFSLVDTVLLRPLPFRDPDRLVMVWEDASSIGFPRNTPAPANFADWKAQNQVFEDMAATAGRSYNLTGDGEPENLEGRTVTGNFFNVLGVEPKLGRGFLSEEDQPGGAKVAVVSYGLWQRRFGGDPGLVGKEILLDGQKHTVVGVMPAGFQFLDKEISLWLPIQFTKELLANRDSHYLNVVARMKPGVSVKQARTEIATIMSHIEHDHPSPGFAIGSTVISLREQLSGGVRTSLIILLSAVGMILMIACANVANLLLARSASRRQEIALRAALGAGSGRILRQLLTESVLLAFLGSAGGLLLALWSFSFLKGLIPESMALGAGLQVDFKVFGFTLLVTLLAGLLFGIAPAMQAVKLDLNEALKHSAGRTGTGGNRLRSALVVTEVAMALVLLIGAGLLIKAFHRLQTMDIGFQPENVLTVRTKLPRSKYIETPKRAAFYDQVLARARALPGVVSAGYTTAVPLTWKGGTNSFSIEGRDQIANQDACFRQVTPGYMESMGMTLKAGRLLSEQDGGPNTQKIALVNETMARQFWPGQNPLGRRFTFGGVRPESIWYTIVGVVGDVKGMGLEAPVKAEMYFPPAQMDVFSFAPRELVLRVKGDPMSLAGAVRQAVWSVDRDQPVSNIRPMEEILADETQQRRLGTTLLGGFAALALLLASVGIYGVLSYRVAQRKQEIGVRMALGARERDVLALVVGQGMKLTLAGVAIGAGAAFALTRLMEGLLFGVSAADPLIFAGIAALLTLAAFIACFLPARRASRIDPMLALRQD
jgi:putative ABC transport system permease protein